MANVFESGTHVVPVHNPEFAAQLLILVNVAVAEEMVCSAAASLSSRAEIIELTCCTETFNVAIFIVL